MKFYVEVFVRGIWIPVVNYSNQGDAVWDAIVRRRVFKMNTRVVNTYRRVILHPQGHAPKGYEWKGRGK